MATQEKTTKAERNQKPTQTAQPAKRKTDTRKIVKALVFGPTIAILGVTLIYMSFWGLSKAFTALHAVVTTYFVPWVGTSWPIIIGVWALVALTSVVYYFVEQYQEAKKDNSQKKKSPNNDKNLNSGDEKNQLPGDKKTKIRDQLNQNRMEMD